LFEASRGEGTTRGSAPHEDGGNLEAAGGIAAREQPDPIDMATYPLRRVLVTGASGFIGSHLLPRLVSRGHLVRAMWRGREGPGRRSAPGVDWLEADVTRSSSLDAAVAECDVVVHLAGCSTPPEGGSLEQVNAVGTRHVLAAAQEAGVERVIYVSALGASPAAGEYFRSRFQAEDAVMSSSLDHVILRPSVVYGPDDHFVTSIVSILRALPVFPMLGDGTFRLQPLAVEDMVDALTQSVERPDVTGELYELAGPDRLSFTRIVRIVGEIAGCARPVVPLSDRFAARAVWLARRAGFLTPFSSEQLDVLRWGSALSGSDNPLRTVFLVKPLPFRDALADYLGSAGLVREGSLEEDEGADGDGEPEERA
jgi:NADH dehydrogenase